jgi:transcriptional regulator GlxA family with amidase domain
MYVMQFAKNTLKFVLYTAVIVAPIAAAAAFSMRSAMAELTAPPRPFNLPDLARPPHDASKPTVVVLGSNNGTEITDFLAPYEVFAATEAFNVYAIAPERTFTPFMWGGVDYAPHYSFAEMDALLQKNPDVIVVPFIKDPQNAEIIDYIRSHAGPETIVVSICGGAYVLAATGLVDHGEVTTHVSIFPLIAKDFPHIKLVRNMRWVDNGATVTSGGITSGIDASLHVVDRLLGREAALAVAARLNYPHTQYLDDPGYVVPDFGEGAFAMTLNSGFRFQRPLIGVYLPQGVGEIDLTATLDTYGRTFATFTHTFAPERTVIRSRHGLDLVPRDSFATLPNVARIIVPGSETSPAEIASLVQWAQSGGKPRVEQIFSEAGQGTFAFDVTLSDLAQHASRYDMRLSATSLEYPTAHLTPPARGFSVDRFAPLAVLTALGLAMAALLKRWIDNRAVGVRRIDNTQSTTSSVAA